MNRPAVGAPESVHTVRWAFERGEPPAARESEWVCREIEKPRINVEAPKATFEMRVVPRALRHADEDPSLAPHPAHVVADRFRLPINPRTMEASTSPRA